MAKRIQLKNKAGTENLNPITTADEVYFSENKTVRQKINEMGSSGGTDANAVHYTADTGKTDAQKAQARTNIGAGTGDYSKPNTGIPKTDLASDVQTSLSKADSALQSHQDISGKQDKATTQNITIAVADWNGGTTCTKSVTGVTSSNIVFCDSSDASVQCTAQGSGTLTFTATSTQTASVTVKVVIFQ